MQEMQSQKSRHKHDKNKRSREKSDNQKKRKYEVPGLENNSLSEELGQPIVSDSVYDSSDNSQNVKRRNDTRSPKDYHNHGSIIDFHFQLQKHKDQAAQSSTPVCSTPGMSTTIAQEMASGPTRETWHPSSRTQVVADEKTETAPAFTFSRSCSMQIESQYRKLIVNWIPHPLQIENPKFDDQEWLFQRRQHRSDMIRRTNAYNDDFSHCHESNVLYPYAQYLSKADIFALPFVTSF
ncbi:uncharacterized protein LOC132165651 isoform X2 [Corylus avellana]|nr:uncharacterized protein LOC132165651 isoform X2 [Corylus avellana]